MARRAATTDTERRVARLVALLFEAYPRDRETIADLARRAGLKHETVRNLWLNPSGKYRSGPGFFVVASIANARDISLDWLAAETLNTGRERRHS
jgi:hypothetical protein